MTNYDLKHSFLQLITSCQDTEVEVQLTTTASPVKRKRKAATPSVTSSTLQSTTSHDHAVTSHNVS